MTKERWTYIKQLTVTPDRLLHTGTYNAGRNKAKRAKRAMQKSFTARLFT